MHLDSEDLSVFCESMLVNFNIKDSWSDTMLSILGVNAFYQILEYTSKTIEQGMSNVPIILETMCHPSNTHYHALFKLDK